MNYKTSTKPANSLPIRPSAPQNGQHPYPSQYAGYQHNLAGGYPQGGFFPVMYGATSFGQALFQPMVNPEGYSYSPSYLVQQSNTVPKKRPRSNNFSADQTGQSVKPWRNCSHPGCKFVGSGEQVETHEEDRHLIFAPGKIVEKSEEEERYSNRKGPLPPIQGTNIILNTPEDIEKWIAERKARWPTSKRMQEKEEEKQAAISRGEILPNNRRNGRKRDAATLAEEWGKPVVENVASARQNAGRNEMGRGRGRGRGGARDAGRCRQSNESKRDAQKVQQIDSTSKESNDSTTVKTVNGLTILETYDTSSRSESSSDSGEEDSVSSSSDTASEPHSDKGNLNESANSIGSLVEPSTAAKVDATIKPLCKFFARSGRCRLNDKCRFSHTSTSTSDFNSNAPTTVQPQPAKKQLRQPLAKRHNAFERPSMLGALLANPIQNTLSQLSQTIRFLAANDMLDNVELRPGQAEEQEREKNKVILLEELEEGLGEGNLKHQSNSNAVKVKLETADEECKINTNAEP
ncbi:uncharacterized protein L203_100758 [Cryptococcus depauperatus CBS 7841]|uniref:Uncharacterized protein n=1 Tax=Cryptococcus depauperatus CBS 7841 TaxID=1295531 RepID=A0A1E3IZE0_9TREE|nr:hypothetical protein L203_00547 [Cryptococcus depauperatus CBS 7841]